MKKLKVTATFAEELEELVENIDLEDGFIESDFSGMYDKDIIDPLFKQIEKEGEDLYKGANLQLKTSAIVFYAIRYGIEIEEPKTFVAYMNFRERVFDETKKMFYGAAFNTSKISIATPFEEDDSDDMKKLKELEKQGWKRMEYKDED